MYKPLVVVAITAASTQRGPAVEGQARRVEMKGIAFVPAQVMARVGDGEPVPTV